MPRSLSLAALALAASASIVLPVSLSAADNGIYYTAKLTAPAADSRYISGGRVWLCDGSDCIAQRSSARPLRVCRDFKRTVGQVSEFTANGRALDADKLAKCNAD